MFITPISPIAPIETDSSKTVRLEEGSGSSVPFVSMLRESLENLQESQKVADQDSLDLALGGDVDLHTAMINSAALSTAVKTTVQLTSRAVSAYKEIMQMQI